MSKVKNADTPATYMPRLGLQHTQAGRSWQEAARTPLLIRSCGLDGLLTCPIKKTFMSMFQWKIREQNEPHQQGRALNGAASAAGAGAAVARG